jgi:DNA-binding XRE family transcriptional regulator
MPEITQTVNQPRRRVPLYALRTLRRLSREELAGMAGVSPRTIYAIEVEGVHPQRATRHVLALALGVAVAELSQDDECRPGEERRRQDRADGRDNDST